VENITDIVRENLRKLLENHSNPRNVALKAGVDYGHLNRILNGQRGIGLDVIETIAAYLQVPYSAFFDSRGGEPIIPTPPFGTTLSDAWKMLQAFEKAEYDTRKIVLQELGLVEWDDGSDLRKVEKPRGSLKSPKRGSNS
jgi:transcriptional regulator with XRE-family HTH domain